MYKRLLGVALLSICYALPAVPTDASHTTDVHMIVIIVVLCVLLVSVLLAMGYLVLDARVIKNLIKKPSSLESIIRKGDLRLLKSSLSRRVAVKKSCSCESKLDKDEIHTAIEMACQYRQCEILFYLNHLLDRDDEVMGNILAQQVRNANIVVDECIPLINCLVACATPRSPLDPDLLSWSIEHSSLKVFNALLVNKTSKHLDLNAYEKRPSPIMACFRRPDLHQAHNILVHLWGRTLEQSCNVDPQTVKDAVNTWGNASKPFANGEVVTDYRREIVLKEIGRIEDQKMAKLSCQKIDVTDSIVQTAL